MIDLVDELSKILVAFDWGYYKEEDSIEDVFYDGEGKIEAEGEVEGKDYCKEILEEELEY